MERVKGIEPSSQAWEARILPLNHTRFPLSAFVTEMSFRRKGNREGSQRMGDELKPLDSVWRLVTLIVFCLQFLLAGD
jgi:hypothetical protein